MASHGIGKVEITDLAIRVDDLMNSDLKIGDLNSTNFETRNRSLTTERECQRRHDQSKHGRAVKKAFAVSEHGKAVKKAHAVEKS
jgi:hypothetical protein